MSMHDFEQAVRQVVRDEIRVVVREELDRRDQAMIQNAMRAAGVRVAMPGDVAFSPIPRPSAYAIPYMYGGGQLACSYPFGWTPVVRPTTSPFPIGQREEDDLDNDEGA